MASQYRGPLRAFRIADRRHSLLDGTGSYIYGNRWNSEGRRVIYAAETYSGALLEILVHANVPRAPRNDAWVQITVPAALSIEEIRANDVPGWDAADLLASRKYGDHWHAERRTAVLLVPSLVTQGIERNVLLNQDHPDFPAISATSPRDVNWDERFFRR